MARKGRAGPALSIAAIGSFVAGTLSIIGLSFIGPPLAKFALKFGPQEYFSLVLFGLTMIAYLSSGSKLKALLMAAVGLTLKTIGIDPIEGITRFTYRSTTLMDGIEITAIFMGLFGITEVFSNIEQKIKKQETLIAPITHLLPNRKDLKDSTAPIGRGTFVGFFLGLIPGIGGTVPTFISYALEKRVSRHPEKFGTGVIEGVAGPESANNAATGSCLIPLLTLGIPSNVVVALLMGALMIQGIQPGPLLIQQHPEVFWGVITSMYTGNVILLILNLPLVGIWVKILKIPYFLLFPLIVLFCIIGVYSVNNNIMDIVVMILFGVIGYFMRKFGYEAIPMVLALVLGGLLELNFRQSLILSRGSLLFFLYRPISAFFMILAFLVVLSVFLPSFKKGLGYFSRQG
jgi:putative tricarboxylic transport membrane protein